MKACKGRAACAYAPGWAQISARPPLQILSGTSSAWLHTALRITVPPALLVHRAPCGRKKARTGPSCAAAARVRRAPEDPQTAARGHATCDIRCIHCQQQSPRGADGQERSAWGRLLTEQSRGAARRAEGADDDGAKKQTRDGATKQTGRGQTSTHSCPRRTPRHNFVCSPWLPCALHIPQNHCAPPCPSSPPVARRGKSDGPVSRGEPCVCGTHPMIRARPHADTPRGILRCHRQRNRRARGQSTGNFRTVHSTGCPVAQRARQSEAPVKTAQRQGGAHTLTWSGVCKRFPHLHLPFWSIHFFYLSWTKSLPGRVLRCQVAVLHRAHTSGFCSALEQLPHSVALLRPRPLRPPSVASGSSTAPRTARCTQHIENGGGIAIKAIVADYSCNRLLKRTRM